ncbi:hypothetical protein F5X98DRAFT_164044 [Xylaria grammica]|nr:hypothetical protein F5X98DRAFT_164044 [Xylaria grammica]
MNWTEGSLARHSRGRRRNALIARQKQHFAKARSSLLNGRPKKAPVSISFLPSESISASSRHGPSHRDHDSKPSTSSSPFIDREPQRERPTDRRDNGREASPKNLDRRRRLLERSDWAGLRLQEPLDISFPGQIYATKIWAGAARHTDRAPSGTGEHATSHEEGRYGRLKRSSMRIRIGSQDIQPSIATGSQSCVEPFPLEPKKRASMSRRSLMSADSPSLSSYGRGPCGSVSLSSDDDCPALSTSLGQGETPINVGYAPSVIHEPTPRRTSRFDVLKWTPSSSEDGGSMRVEIERPVRPVPPSQESEQRRWKDWILCEESLNLPPYSPVLELDTSGISIEGSESSAITLPSHLQPRLPSFRLSSDPSLEPGQVPEHSLRQAGIERITQSNNTFKDDLCPSNNHNPLRPRRRCVSPKESDVPDDLNEVWRKFACGDDENNEEILKDAFKEAAHQAAVELQPSDTSGSADEYTETAATCGTELSSLDHRHKHGPTPSDISSESHMATKGTVASETASANIDTVVSSDEMQHSTKLFTLPKAFIGKHANADQASIAQPLPANTLRNGKKIRGKKRKRATDGRTDIRSLPDFDGDPIEEIEDDSFL